MKKSYQNVLGDMITRAEVMKKIEEHEDTFLQFQEFPEKLQEELIAFCMGNWGVKITYDPFFKYIFNPELHPERLSEFLSFVLQEEVEVLDVLPNESNRVTESGSMLITDILVKLKTGAYANVEIQKIGYTFPGQRCACYSSDLLMRQLARLKREAKKFNRKFSYKDVKKVYTIVLVEESSSVYWNYPDKYIHRGKQTFDTGLQLDLLQEYIIIPLDVFRQMTHNELNKLEAWLYFISSDSPMDIGRIVEVYPEFRTLYQELLALRYDIEELVRMFDYYRQLLRELDEDAVEYMVEEQRKKIDELKRVKNQLKEESAKLQETNERLQEEHVKMQETNERLQEEHVKMQVENERLQEEVIRLKKIVEGV